MIVSNTVLRCVTLSIVAWVYAVAQTATIMAVWPKFGSMAGGTYMVIKGVGFSRNGMPGTTTVYFNGNQLCSQPQGVVLDSSDTNFVCFSPPMPTLLSDVAVADRNLNMDVPITMRIDLADGSSYWAGCAAPNGCVHRYRKQVTPLIIFGSLGGYASSVLKFYGNLRDNLVLDYWIRFGGAPGSGVGGSICDASGPLQPGLRGTGGPTNIVNKYSLDMTVATAGTSQSEGLIVCRLVSGNATSEAGRYLLNFEPRDIYNSGNAYGYGNAYFSIHNPQTPSMLPATGPVGGVGRATTQAIGFGFTYRPVILSVNVVELGVNGGANIIINGAGFSTRQDNVVYLAGNVSCNITYQDSRTIVCTAAAAPNLQSSPIFANNTLYPGGAGLQSSVFWGTNLTGQPLTDYNSWYTKIQSMFSNYNVNSFVNGTLLPAAYPARPSIIPPAFSTVNGDSVVSRFWYYGWSTAPGNYVQEMEGFFMPPVSAYFSFYVRGDDDVMVFLSPDANPSNMQPVSVSKGENNNWWLGPRTMMGSKFWADANVPRYYKVVHRQNNGDHWFDVGLKVYTKMEDNTVNMDVAAKLVSSSVFAYKGSFMIHKIAIQANSGGYRLVFDLGNGSPPITTAKLNAINLDAWWVRYRNIMAAISQVMPWLTDIWLDEPDYYYNGNYGWFGHDLYMGNGNNPPIPYGSGNGLKIWGANFDAVNPALIYLQFYGPVAATMKPVQVISDPDYPLGFSTGNVTIDVTILDQGGDLFYWPAPMDFFRTALPLPAVQVISNGLNAVCNPVLPYANTPNSRLNYFQQGVDGAFPPIKTTKVVPSDLNGCSIVYNANITPTITSVTIISGSEATTADGFNIIRAGTVLRITGTNFIDDAMAMGKGSGNNNLTVTDRAMITLEGTSLSTGNLTYVNGLCIVYSSTRTDMYCTIDDMPEANYTTLTANVALGRGFTLPAAVTYNFVASLGSISPSMGSRAGGTMIYLMGSGFMKNGVPNNVNIGGEPCTVIWASSTNITCLTPPYNDGKSTATAITDKTSVAVPVIVNGKSLAGVTFTYTAALTPVVSLMTPTTLSTAVTGIVVLNLTNIEKSRINGNNNFVNVSVAFGNRPCTSVTTVVTSVSSTTASIGVTCSLLRIVDTLPTPHIPLPPVVTVADLGYAAVDTDTGRWTLDTSYYIYNVSRTNSSMGGGVRLQIYGKGFGAKLSNTVVRFSAPSIIPNGAAIPTVDCLVDVLSSEGTYLECSMGRPDFENNRFLFAARNTTCIINGYLNVLSNNVPSACGLSDNCTFTFIETITPMITKVDFNNSLVTNTATLYGKLLDATTTIWLGTRQATILSNIPSNDEPGISIVTFSIPPQPAGTVSLFVNTVTYGNADGAWKFNFTYPVYITNVTRVFAPSTTDALDMSGSVSGGQKLNISGIGFSDNLQRNVILFGSTTTLTYVDAGAAQIVAIDYVEGRTINSIIILTPPAPVNTPTNTQTVITVNILDSSLKSVLATSSSYTPPNPSAYPVPNSLYTSARYVRYHIEASLGISLNIAEVRVYNASGFNLVRLPGVTASATSTYYVYSASKAIDNNNGTFWHSAPPCDDACYLQVDLGADYLLSSVDLVPRQDCCGERTSQTQIILLNANSQVMWKGTLGVYTSSNIAYAISVPEFGERFSPKYTYLSTNMPKIISVNPVTGVTTGTLLTITGTNLGYPTSNAPMGEILIGNSSCVPVTWSNSSITCTVQTTPAGTHTVLVYTPNAGLANYTLSTGTVVNVTVPLTVSTSSSSTVTVGSGGGSILTITGTGFATQENGYATTGSVNYVTVCGEPAKIVNSNSTAITFTVPSLPTKSVGDKHNTLTEDILTGTVLSTSNSTTNLGKALDGSETTSFTACNVILDLGTYKRAVVTRIRFFPLMGAYTTFAGSLFSGSNTKEGPYTPLWSVSTAPLGVVDGWNIFMLNLPSNLSSQTSYRYLQWNASESITTCTAMELEFTGKVVMDNEAIACPITVEVQTPPLLPWITTPVSISPVTLSTTVTVSTVLTPAIYSISPSYGSALGGDLITFTGVGFGPGVTSIILNSMPCAVQTVTSTSVTCITGVRTSIQPVAVRLLVNGVGMALVNDTTNTYFSYLDKWSALTTWLDNEPPVDGDTVVVPKGQAVLVDVPTPKLFLVLVQGEIRFEDNPLQPLTFDAHYITVLGGKFVVGTEAQPFMSKLTITLHGDRNTAVEIPGFGAKCLSVMPAMDMGDMSATMAYMNSRDTGAVNERNRLKAMQALMGGVFGQSLGSYNPYYTPPPGPSMSPLDQLLAVTMAPVEGKILPPDGVGYIDIHGAPRQRVWTFGNTTAPAGTTIITTSEDTDWQPGEHLVISPTSSDYTQAEEVIILTRNSPRNYTLTAPLAFTHECFWYNSSQYGFTDTRICYEVGLLSRNVIIQGDESSTDQQFGVHSIAAMGSVARIENTEMRRCGQSLIVGRYCWHVHCAQNEKHSYAKSNSFHDSFQRAATVHASNNVLVQNNVAYKVMAHTFFVEDGIEQNNIFDGNLVVQQLTSAGPIRSDSLASCFWTASPANRWTNNVCAGSAANGVWFNIPDKPTGPSATDRIIPSNFPLGGFYNNTIHSTGMGIFAWLVLTPQMCNAASDQFVLNNTIWRNGMAMFLGTISPRVYFHGNKIIENGNGILFHKLCNNYRSNVPQIVDTLVVATMNSSVLTPSANGGIIMPMDDYFYQKGSVFVNFGANNPPISTCSDNGCLCNVPSTLRSGAITGGTIAYGYTYRTEGLKFFNTPARIYWDRAEAVHDLDGSLTNSKNSFIAGYRATNLWPECWRGDAVALGGGVVCAPNVTFRVVHLSRETPDPAVASSLVTIGKGNWQVGGAFNTSTGTDWTNTLTGKNMFLVTGHYYDVKYATAQDWSTVSVRFSDAETLKATTTDEWIGLTFTWSTSSTRYSIDAYYPSVSACSDASAGYPCPEQITLPKMKKNTYPLPGSGNASIAFGTSNFPSGPSNNTWSVVLSTIVPPGQTKFPHTTNDKSIWTDNTFSFDATYNLCPPLGCNPAPPGGDLGAPIAFSTIKDTWIAGADIVINPTDYIVLDESPPAMGNIYIYGRIEFVDSITSTPLTLTATGIVVFGSLSMGTPAAPLRRPASIVLTGNRDTPNVVADNRRVLGNKGLVIFGNVTMAGTRRTTTWTRLASTASAGSTTLTLTTSTPGWVAGDVLVLAETEYSSHNSTSTTVEEVTIASVSEATVTLTTPLRFTHYSGPVSGTASSPLSKVKIAAAVGLLTRNVMVVGDLSAVVGTSFPNYGARIYVSTITLGTGPTLQTYKGQLIADSVQFKDMAQEGMAWSGIEFDMAPLPGADAKATANWLAKPVLPSSLAFISIQRSYSTGIAVKGHSNFNLTGSVIFNTRSNGVYVQKNSLSPTINNNFVVGNYFSPATYCCGNTGDFVIGQAGFMIGSTPSSLADNYASGMADIGFVINGDDCANAANPLMRNNEAVGTHIGFIILPKTQTSGCILATGLTAWKAAHIGIYPNSIARNSFHLTNSLVTDNHMGIFVFGSHYDTSAITFSLSNVSIVGTSLATVSNCSISTRCRSISKNDLYGTQPCHSAFGPNFRRVGLVIPLVQNDIRIRSNELFQSYAYMTDWFGCALQWDERYGLGAGPFWTTQLTGVTFANFVSNECGQKSVAIALHPGETDQSLPVITRTITWENTLADARFWFPSTSVRPLITDLDGTLLSAVSNPATLLGVPVSPGIAEDSPTCTAVQTYGGAIQCSGLLYRNFMLQSIDMVQGLESNVLAATTVTRTGASGVSHSNVYTHDTGMACSLAGFFIQPNINFVGLANDTIRVQIGSTEPAQTRFYFNSPDPTEKVLIQFFLTRPNSQAVFVNGIAVPSITDKNPDIKASALPLPKLSDPIGTSLYRVDQKILYFVMGGGYKYIDIVRQPSVIVALTVTPPPGVPLDTAPIISSLASLLSIPATRIKVVNVAPLGGRLRMLVNSTDSNSTSGPQTLSIEIAPETPTVAAAPIVSAGASMNTPTTINGTSITVNSGNGSVVTASTTGNTYEGASANTLVNSTLNNLAAYTQQTAMVSLGMQLAELASTGAITQAIVASTNYTVQALNVTPPQIAVVQPNLTEVSVALAAQNVTVVLPSASPSPTPTSTATSTSTSSSTGTSTGTTTGSTTSTFSSGATASTISATPTSSLTPSGTPSTTSTFSTGASPSSSPSETPSNSPSASASGSVIPQEPSAQPSPAPFATVELNITFSNIDTTLVNNPTVLEYIKLATINAVKKDVDIVVDIVEIVDTVSGTKLYENTNFRRLTLSSIAVKTRIGVSSTNDVETFITTVKNNDVTFATTVLSYLVGASNLVFGSSSIAGFAMMPTNATGLSTNALQPYVSSTVITASSLSITPNDNDGAGEGLSTMNLIIVLVVCIVGSILIGMGIGLAWNRMTRSSSIATGNVNDSGEDKISSAAGGKTDKFEGNNPMLRPSDKTVRTITSGDRVKELTINATGLVTVKTHKLVGRGLNPHRRWADDDGGDGGGSSSESSSGAGTRFDSEPIPHSTN